MDTNQGKGVFKLVTNFSNMYVAWVIFVLIIMLFSLAKGAINEIREGGIMQLIKTTAGIIFALTLVTLFLMAVYLIISAIGS